MEKFIFSTPNGMLKTTNAEKAARYKIYCENQGWKLVTHGGNVWEGWLYVYAE